MSCSVCEEDKPRSAFSSNQMDKAEKKCKTCLAGTHWLFFLTPTVHSSRHVLCSFVGAFLRDVHSSRHWLCLFEGAF